MTTLTRRGTRRKRATGDDIHPVSTQRTSTRGTSASESARRVNAQLGQLARLCGIETEYRDDRKQQRLVPIEGLLGIVRLMDARVETLADVPNALRERRAAIWKQTVEPVIVAWDGIAPPLEINLPAGGSGPVRLGTCELVLETGEKQRIRTGRLNTISISKIEGADYVVKQIMLPRRLPYGYHRLRLDLAAGTAEALVISAPARAFGESVPKTWGVFAPVYSLHSARSWGAGDLGDLESLIAWTHQLGGGAVATLPLLATFLDEPFEPSPYSPASRLFWNEFFLDLESIPEMKTSISARALLRSPEIQSEIEGLRGQPLVDYRRGMAAKRRVLERLTQSFFKRASSARQEQFRQFLASHPLAEDYARFRAVGEEQRRIWPEWPERLRERQVEQSDYREQNQRYHLYVQWLADERLKGIAAKARKQGPGLCLDMPLGIHSAGYDVWRHRELFVRQVNAGSPPDSVFTGGQNWGFQPFHPEAIRRSGYAYYIASLRQQLQHAGLLRIDHVMGLHRLFWIPPGLDPAYGTYVRYHAEELYAILSLESHRSRSLIAGENLGTVPPYVGPAMKRHNIQGLFVVEYELAGKDKLPRVPPDTVASLNTHDMAQFGSFWKGLDIEERINLGFLPKKEAPAEFRLRRRVRKSLIEQLRKQGWLEKSGASAGDVLHALLQRLSATDARILQINLEDLWLETQPQNVPCTGDKRPNWRRQGRYPLEILSGMPEVEGILAKVSRLRKVGLGAKLRGAKP